MVEDGIIEAVTNWTAQSALHFPPLADLFIPTPFSASLGSILAMQQLRNDYTLTFPPLSIARYSFIQLSRLRRREVKENAQTSKRYQRGFEPGLSRLRVRHSTTEPPRSTQQLLICSVTLKVLKRTLMILSSMVPPRNNTTSASVRCWIAVGR